jgi:competence protein ComEC
MINQLLPEPHAGLLVGMVFGTKANLSIELKQALIDTGTIHITALSGMNISIISSLVATTLHRLFSRRITCLLTICIIIGFVFFVGPSASIVRAALMGSLSLISIIFGRQRRALYLLLVTSIVMVIFYPAYLTDISFQLSVLSTCGIIVLGNHQTPSILSLVPVANSETLLVETVQTTIKSSAVPLRSFLILLIPSWIKDDLRMTLSAQIFTMPLIAFQFHRISLIAPIANLAIGFVIVPLTVLGLLLCLVSHIFQPLAVILAWIAYLLLDYLVSVVIALGQVPYSSISW